MDNLCPKCGAYMKISQRTGKPYCSALCWQRNVSSQVYNPVPAPNNGNALLMEEIVALRKEMNERFDAMSAYFAKKDAEK